MSLDNELQMNGGYFEYFFTPTRNGMYVVELATSYYDFNKNQNVESKEIRTVPVDLKNNNYSVFAEGEDFALEFDEDQYYYHTIKNIDFSKEEKRLSIEFVHHYPNRNGFDVSIPHKLLNGDYTVFLNDVMLDPNARSNDLSRVDISMWHGMTGIGVTVSGQGTYKVDIYGTSAIPEFNAIILLVLSAAFVPIVLLSKFGRLAI